MLVGWLAGWLVGWLVVERGAEDLTHVIVDEVHERDVHNVMTLLLIKLILCDNEEEEEDELQVMSVFFTISTSASPETAFGQVRPALPLLWNRVGVADV